MKWQWRRNIAKKKKFLSFYVTESKDKPAKHKLWRLRNIKQNISSVHPQNFIVCRFTLDFQRTKMTKFQHSSRCFGLNFNFQIENFNFLTRNCVFGAIQRVVVKQAMKAATIKSVFMRLFQLRKFKDASEMNWTEFNACEEKFRKKNKFSPEKHSPLIWATRECAHWAQSQRNAR